MHVRRDLSMPKQFHIPDHLILPFGTATKFDISRIKLSSVGGNGVYFTSDIPCIYIDRSKREPLTLSEFPDCFVECGYPDDSKDVLSTLVFMEQIIERHIPKPTPSQIKFLRLYFDHIKLQCSIHRSDPDKQRVAYNAMLPLPEMQIYVHDPLQDDFMGYEPTNNFRVDFGFWTGTRLVGVEIDGNEPGGYAEDVRRDRLLRCADVDLIHILNTEIAKYGARAVRHLLPPEILFHWQKREAPKFGPSWLF